jgi:dolichol-phosphate mannosyltransferase
MRPPFRLSLAIPVFNEADVLPELIRRVTTVLDGIPGGPHEVVFVDDGSRDETPLILEDAARADRRIVSISLSRNFGHQAAITAALDAVSGDAVVVMDADLQDEPEQIPRFLSLYAKGYDVVFAQRRERKEGIVLRSCYFLYYRVISWLADTQLPLDSGDFALLSRRVVDQLRAAPEHNRYLRGLRSWVGFRQVGLEVERAERAAGTSKYNFLRLLRLAFDGIFSFSTMPLRAATFMGLAVLACAVFYTGYAVYVRLILDRSPVGFTAQLLITVVLLGIQLIILGVMGEYIGRIYEEVKRRPIYIIGRTVRDDAGAAIPNHAVHGTAARDQHTVSTR